METYVENHCKHQDLFQSVFRESWLDDRFLRVLHLVEAAEEAAKDKETSYLETENNESKGSQQQQQQQQQSSLSSFVNILDILRSENIVSEIFPSVFSIPIFTPLICSMIIEETENFLDYAAKHNVEVFRPNSMNNYGLVLNMIGMRDLLTDFQLKFLHKFSRALYPLEASHFSSHHTFIVSYEPDKDRALDMHTDDSDVTWNICLGKEGFVGSGLTFCGEMGQSRHRKLQGHYAHQIGHAVVHLGRQRHGADVIQAGERHNLIMWCRNNHYRNSLEYQQRIRSYESEEGPPDLQCLSFTHDRDFIAFKEYPAGKNPYTNLYESESNDTADEVMLPWCPPPQFGYSGMPSHNKLMFIHYKLECEKEDSENKK